MNKFLLILILIFLTVSLITLFYPFNHYAELYSTSAAEITALILMIGNGTFMNTRYYTAFRVVIGLVIIGALLKILHLTGADQILLISLSAAPVVYIAYFIAKKEKRLLDVLKVITAVSFFLFAVIKLLHLVSPERMFKLQVVPHALFWITFICFVAVGAKNKTLFSN